MKTSAGNLSKPQLRLLLELPEFGVMHVVSYNKPAKGLVKLGLAYWHKEDKLALTNSGLAMKCSFNRKATT